MRISLVYSALIIGAVSLLSACSAGGDNTGYEYAPNMYNSFAYEPMTQLEEEPNTINPHGMNMREPVKNTVARGQFDYGKYDMKVSNESYEAAAALKNPLPASAKNIAAGNRLYNINCTPCHGEKGAGDGTIVAAGKYPPPPDYNSDRIKTTPDGKMFYSIKYGKNLMGAYGTVLSPEQIWQVVHYIHSVNGTAPYTAATASK
jgi:mono/diheme cytochrome c family protein